jgi:Tol biopolymer transport system component
MGLSPGDRLGHYQVLSPLGAGGMGQVFRARDSRLNRDVAIKIVSDGFASDPERLARLTREAHSLAALNHPHIAHIYGIEDDGDTHALVMELVEGEDLAIRLSRGKLPLPEVLNIARQIAEAVEAAHEKGIVHRDLKPSNIMIDGDGRVRVLDFGLATAPEPAFHDTSSAATVTSPAKLTGRGVIVGTPAYMSPEQVTGQAADKRCDVWAFGCVLFEMLSGRRAFDGRDTHDAMMAVASQEPDWSTLPAGAPAAVRKLLKRCLDKNRKRRLSDMGVVRLELEEMTDGAAVPAPPAPVPPPRGRERTRVIAPTVIALAGIAAAAYVALRPAADLSRAMIRVSADVGAPISLNISQGASAVLSAKGDRLVFVGQPRSGSGAQRLYTRRLDTLTTTPIAGTDGAMNPFFSPDGEWLGFFANSKLRKIAVAGGTAIDLADVRNARGGSWGDDNQIVFTPDFYSGLWRVPAGGGTAVQLTVPADDRTTHRWPHVLPGSKAVIYTSNSSLFAYENSDVVLQPLPGGTPRVLQKNAFFGQYLTSGHLIFIHKGALHAAPFDPNAMAISGEALPVLDDVSTGSLFTGAAQFSTSNDGTAVYVAGRNFTSGFTTLDRSGKRDLMLPEIHNWGNPQFSPDGRRFAFDMFDGVQADVWVYDLAGRSLSRLTHSPRVDVKPIWSPDGKRIAFITQDDYRFRTDWQLADGSGGAKTLIGNEIISIPTSFHPSGRYLAYVELTSKTGFDAKVAELDFHANGDWRLGRTIDISSTPASELEPMFSPDGRWIAYGSAHTGRSEIYVRPFPDLNGTWQVSTEGGAFPTWSKSGNELLFATLDQRIMSVSYAADGGSFRATAPRTWTNERHQLSGPTFMRNFVSFPDGERVAFSKAADSGDQSSDPVVMVFNFFDELRRKVPVR